MTWLFIRFYVCVLIVLSMAWYIHGSVVKSRADAEWERVIVEAHGGGARLVASELDASPPESRERVLKSLRERFAYPVDVIALTALPNSLQRQITSGDDVACFRPEKRYYIVAALSGGAEVVRLGPFPNYDLQEIEQSLGGWMRLTANRLDAATPGERQAVLKKLQERSDISIDIVGREDLPAGAGKRIVRGEDIVFYSQNPEPNERWFAATPLSDRTEVVRFGPFPSFERIEQKAATTTLALVLLPAALAIALLLRPVARQLRRVEHAAQAIAAGDLSARVDERRVRSAKPLAQAFNNMASRTEALVRTQRELLQAVSHELRTPLSRMRFAIDLIETAKDDQERKRRLESLDAGTEELDQLVGELLSYVRMETTEPKLDLEHVALHDTLGVLIPKHAALYPTIQFEVSENVAEGSTILADRTGFQRAIGNLLSNAGQYARSRVKISMERADRVTIVDVDDDGNGIPESEKDRVFEPFVRLENDANGHGAGLGLALVKRIVTQHGGSVEVLTSPLGGCRIRTIWPA
ncbi:MAG: HAMP domain-containing protein [Pirellulaceae bacterium]|nr:HAMP domain-containing protein [Pirellulaceae bacterium]